MNLGILGDELLRRIEEECATARVSLRIVPHGIIETQVQDWSEYAEIFPSLHRRSKEGGKVVLGYLSALPGSGESAKRIIRFLSQLNEPVSILEQIGSPPSRSFPPTRSTMRVFSLARNVEASTAVAGFLLARGHRKVAFISGHHGMQWSRIRFDTIRDRYRNAGLNNGVACFAADRQVLDIRRNALRNRALEKIMRPSTAILKRMGLENSRFFEVSLEGSLRRFLGNSTLYRTLLPLFEEACRHEDVSAWVCVNDVTALLALEYLRTRRIAVPEKLSVIGFDNSPEALASNLTSYSFNPDRLAHAMVHHILFPGSSSSPRAVPRLTEVKGRIVERGTVGHRPTPRG